MKYLLLNLFILFSLISFGGQITKFTNSSPVFYSEPYEVYFLDKTQDFFGKPLVDITWTWNFGDGIESHNINPIHRYLRVGDYIVKCTTTDTITNFQSDYSKLIKVKNFKDSCSYIVLDTVKIPILDTVFVIVTDTIYITMKDGIKVAEYYEVYDIRGIKVLSTLNFDDVDRLKDGLYIVKNGERKFKLTVKR
jgi:hypothetical protein